MTVGVGHIVACGSRERMLIFTVLGVDPGEFESRYGTSDLKVAPLALTDDTNDRL